MNFEYYLVHKFLRPLTNNTNHVVVIVLFLIYFEAKKFILEIREIYIQNKINKSFKIPK